MENTGLNEQVLDKLTKVCLCKAISRAKIKDTIKGGAHTLEAVTKATGACTGGCNGFRCKEKIQGLIDQHLETLQSE